MPPKQFNNFAEGLRTLLSKYNLNLRPQMRKLRFTLPSKALNFNTGIAAANPIQNIVKNLQSNLSQITKARKPEDYNAVVKSFIPANSFLITPESPRNSKSVQSVYLDGDSSRSLISTYKLNNEIRTLVLKKTADEWYKAAEISNPDHEGVHYRGVANLKGEGKKQLLLGLTNEKSGPTMYGYSLDNNRAQEVFRRKYSRVEVFNSKADKSAGSKSQIAFWDKRDEDSYDIEVHHWNGSKLEPHENSAPYIYNRVVPYYAKKVKQNPNTVSNWYNLADTLSKSGLKRDALTVIKVGMKYDQKSEFKDKFLKLKEEINK